MGNLFRDRGEVDRALRVHQNVIARSNLNAKQKQKAMYALGQDFFAAGMLDRSESVFKELLESNVKWIPKADICTSLRTIYEQTQEWQKAVEATDCTLDKHADKGRIQLDYPEDLLLLGVNIEIEGICINLAENALKYTTPDTTIQIKWGITNRDEYVFSVEDQGPGIETEDLSKLTRRYYRGAKSRADTSGSGLGLAIVQHAATKHGATFEIDSTPTKGSRFSVTFPSYRCIQ